MLSTKPTLTLSSPSPHAAAVSPRGRGPRLQAPAPGHLQGHNCSPVTSQPVQPVQPVTVPEILPDHLPRFVSSRLTRPVSPRLEHIPPILRPSPPSATDSSSTDLNNLTTFFSSPDIETAGLVPNSFPPRPSQIGYLTTSSPIVQATHQPELQSPAVRPREASSELAPPTPSLVPNRLGSVDSDSRSSQSSRSRGSLLPPKRDAKRSPSPVGSKIRGVFKSKKGQAADAGAGAGAVAGASPERKHAATTDNDNDNDNDTYKVFDGLPSSDNLVKTEVSAGPHIKTPPSTAASSDRNESAQRPLDASRVVASSPERRHSRNSSAASNRIPQSRPPVTPPSAATDDGAAAPVIVNTPPTPTERHSGTFPFPRPSSKDASPTADATNGSSSSPWGSLTSYKRSRAGSAGPSKLSNTTFAPLTPTLESPPTNSNSNANTSSSPSPGFFSSMLSAAQTAATQFGSSIQNTNPSSPSRGRAVTTTNVPADHGQENKNGAEDSEDSEKPTDTEPFPAAPNMDGKEPAVKTLGDGELTLNQLGIVDSPSVSGTPTATKFSESNPNEARSRAESAPADTSPTVNEFSLDDARRQAQQRPLPENGVPSDRTPPISVYEDKPGSGVHRSGSIRSAMGSRRRQRGSSTTTRGTSGTATIGAAIAAANSSITHPSQPAPQQRLTGFAVASKRRNRDFHALFKSVPDDDYLIEDYSCALQREILAHGRLYVSEGHLCFSSNILGWATTLVMSFDEIVSVEKRSTALLFKNGLMITTLHAKHVFASFTSRDSTYDLIVNIWKLGHPTLKSSLNGIQLEGTGGDKTEKIDGDTGEVVEGGPLEGDEQSLSGSDVDSEDADDIYDEDDDDGSLDPTQPTELMGDSDPDRTVSKKPSAAVGGANGSPVDLAKDVGPPIAVDEFPGPAAHAPTDCGDASSHFEKVVGDDVIPAPLGKVYNLMFGPASVTFMSKWLTTEAKCWDLVMEDKKGLTTDNKSRSFSYIKPLAGSIGPSKTKCITSEAVDQLDLERAVTVTCSTQTPDVPSGNAFITKTKYCLSWADNNSTRVQANCMVEWTAKSWLKGPITNGANDGQTQYCNDLFASLKAAVTSRPRSGTGSNRGAGKKKRGKKARNLQAAAGAQELNKHAKKAQVQNWGPFEALRPILGPVGDVVQPLVTGNVMYGLLVGLLVAMWFGYGFPNGRTTQVVGPYGFPDRLAVDRLAAYEEMWRREETELWDWLEERVGLERLNDNRGPTRKPIEPRTVEERVREERMDEREIAEAIRVTEEKLQVLKGVMGKKKGESGGGDGGAEQADGRSDESTSMTENR